MQFKDYYALLGVDASAGQAEIKNAYRRLARKYHPDVSKEQDAEEQIKAINEAYEVLRDPKKKAAYDQLRGQGYRPGDDYPGGEGTANANSFHFNDFFNNVSGSGGYSDFFESVFANARRGRRPDSSSRVNEKNSGPKDVRAKISVPLEAVCTGSTLRVKVHSRTLEVRIPKGIQHGQCIRLQGQGTQNGHLILEVEYAPHPHFEADGRNILYTLQLTPWQAALGTVASVPTLGGVVELKIPPDSEAGRKLRLRGRGLPGNQGEVEGDQIVVLEIIAPVPKTAAQRAAYRALEEAFS